MPVVNFSPIHRHLAGLGNPYCDQPDITPTVDPDTGLGRASVTSIINHSAGRFFPDNAYAKYSDILSPETDHPDRSPFTANGQPLPFSTKPKVAIVGAGMAGLLTAYQLNKAGMRVDIYEAGRSPLTGVGAGRNAPVILSGGGFSKQRSAKVQLGAMRFPSGSHLFWHYVKTLGVKSGNDIMRAFPNINKVPTAYTAGDPGTYSGNKQSVLAGMWKERNGGRLPNHDDGNDYDYEDLNERHFAAITNYYPPGGPDKPPAGANNSDGSRKMTIGDAANMVSCGLDSDPSWPDLMTEFWTACIKGLYDKTYEGFLRERLRVNPAGTLDDDIEKIGHIGLGTGGFGPLFSRSMLEMMRLIIWNYDDEYELEEQGDIPTQFLNKINSIPNGSTDYFSEMPVKGVIYSRRNKKYSILVPFIYDREKIILKHHYDYLVLAMSNQAAQKLLEQSESEITSRFSQEEIDRYIPDHMYPYYDKRVEENMKKPEYAHFPKSLIKRDLEKQDGMHSVKIFQTMTGPGINSFEKAILDLDPWWSVSPTSGNDYEPLVKTAFGSFNENWEGYQPLGLTYVLPVRLGTDASGARETFSHSPTVVALHYNWGATSFDDTSNWVNEADYIYKNLLSNDSTIKSSIEATGFYFGTSGYLKDNLGKAVQARHAGYLSQVEGIYSGSSRLRLHGWAKYFGAPDHEPKFAIVNWIKVPHIWVGFKLDRPGFGAPLIGSYKIITRAHSFNNNHFWEWHIASASPETGGTTFINSAIKNLYFAGDAMSHYGGWFEGAYQSALNTSAGIIQSAATAEWPDSWGSKVRKEGAIDPLVEKARAPLDYLQTHEISSEF